MKYILDTEGRYIKMGVIQAFIPDDKDNPQVYHPSDIDGDPEMSISFTKAEVLIALGVLTRAEAYSK